MDLNSLYSLSQTNRKVCALVESYIKTHSQQQFTITNEFFTPLNYMYNRAISFSQYVTYLRINIFNWNIRYLRGIMYEFINLKKMYVCTSTYNQPADLIKENVGHLIFDGKSFQTYSEWFELSCRCPDLEMLELKQVNLKDINITGEPLRFRKLKTFKFVFHSNEQLQKLQAIFKDTNTQLIFWYQTVYKVWIISQLNKKSLSTNNCVSNKLKKIKSINKLNRNLS